MRITGGELKGLNLSGKLPEHVRPTTDMMREALFNKLSHTTGIEGMRVLDLFCGSGIVSLEFLSRGAAEVVSVDRDMRNISSLQKFKKEKDLDQWQLHKRDVYAWVKDNTAPFDIVFADPPYDMPNFSQLPNVLLPLLAEDGILIVEHRPGTQFQLAPAELRKHGSSAIAIFAAPKP
jgi:16S rRNA (guanine(966)-N(2))-methyltransferase RsmD